MLAALWRGGSGGAPAQLRPLAAAAVVAAWCRGFAGEASEAQSTLLREYQPSRPQPAYLPFELTVEEGVQKFLAWQRQNRLNPGDLLSAGTHAVHAVLLPFWLFSAQVHVRYTGLVGVRSGGALHWRDAGWHDLPPESRSMQIYASYKYRRDFARAVCSSSLLSRVQPLGLDTVHDLVTASDSGSTSHCPALHLPSIRQAVAWELLVQAVREQEIAAAKQRLKEQHNTAQVRDVRVAVHFSHRDARLAFLPAFHLSYQYGETFNAHGERVPERFEALTSGTAEGGVAGQRHYSSQRASLFTGGALAAGALGVSAAAAPLVGLDPWSLVNIESGFAFFLACSGAGLGARAFPLLLAQARESRRVQEEEAEMDKVLEMGLGPMDAGSEEAEHLRSAAEWRRWQESGKEQWEEGKRAAWAEAIFEGQHRRRAERARVRQRMQEEQARAAADEQREERRRARWGHSSHHHARHGYQEGGGGGFAGGRRAGGRSDFLGYYALLGLDSRRGASGEDIKRAFRQAALKYHPDRVHAETEAERHAARDKFQQLARAYQCLKDPETRRQYDRGDVGQM